MSIIERAPSVPESDSTSIAALHTAFAEQKRAFTADPYPSLDERVAQIQAVVEVVLAHRDEMKAALQADFGRHPEAVADLIEILGVAARAEYNLRHLEEWMRADERELDPALWGGASASVRPQPKGVIGNMVPWNFPFDISFGPLIDMLGAGNRVILKPSDLSPACGELIASMIAKAFEPERVTVVCGGLELAKAFPTLAWDHLLYTGGPAVGKSVMRAAAENLVPVTLELGGKSPAILAADSVDATSVANVIGMKLLKSGQVCVAPDHVLVPRDQLDEFVTLATDHVREMVPGASGGQDVTGIIADQHLERLERMLDQARDAGYTVIQPDADGEVNRETRQMPLSLVVDPGEELDVVREEIFGPILPVVPYDDLDEAIASINAGERPLGLFIYTQDSETADHVLATTHSGGACVNLSVLHGALAPLPFGGSGNSGMGRHHGVEGFREFSNPRGVFVRGKSEDVVDAFNPPYRTLEAIVEAGYAQIDGAA